MLAGIPKKSGGVVKRINNGGIPGTKQARAQRQCLLIGFRSMGGAVGA